VKVAHLSLAFLNTFQSTLNSVPITRFRSSNNQALLVYLALQPGRPFPREVLATLFWPDESEQTARNNLRQALYQLRKVLGDLDSPEETFLEVTRQTVQFNDTGNCELDVRIFLSAIDQGDLANAVELYSGELLPGFTCDSYQFEEWLLLEREKLHQLALQTMYELTQEHLTAGRFDRAQDVASRQISLEPWREQAHYQLMEAYAMAGDRAKALAQYELCRQRLLDELGLEPERQTTNLYEAIKAGKFERRQVLASIATPEKVRNNLPSDTTPFIGRESELALLDELILAEDSHLVTIAGPGGMGKTRLALAYAQRQLARGERFPDGIFFIDLSPLNSADMIMPALAGSMEFSFQADDRRSPERQLLDYLAPARMLLVFDNFEHLLAGVDLLTRLIQSSSRLKIIATSQQRLQLHAEQVYSVQGLECPDLETGADLERYSAVGLFVQSARRNRPEFAIHGQEDRTLVVEICRKVAGMPLALELAASWADAMPLASIATGLQHGLDFLETDMRDLPERQRSIRAAINYSWQQLEPDERKVFARLSIFQGGFTRIASADVAGANPRGLARLVNKSFLQFNSDLDRYQIHGLLRAYGSERLSENGQEELTIAKKHAAYYLKEMKRWEQELQSERWLQAAEQIELSFGNVKKAWDFSIKQGIYSIVIDAVSGLGIFFDATGRWLEGAQFLQSSLSALDTTSPKFPTSQEAARLFIWLSSWQLLLTRVAAGIDHEMTRNYQQYLEPALAMLDHPSLVGSDTRAEEAFVRLELGRVLKYVDERWDEGYEHLQTSRRLYRELGDKLAEADTLYESHFYYHFYDIHRESSDKADRLLDEALSMIRNLGEPRRLIRVLNSKGIIALDQDSFEEANLLFQEAYQTAYRTGDLISMAESRHAITHLAWNTGEFDLALQYTEEMVQAAQAANNQARTLLGMALQGMTLVYCGQFLQAENHFQAVVDYQRKHNLDAEPAYYLGTGMPLARLHAGLYDQVPLSPNPTGISWRMVWVHLLNKEFHETLTLAKQLSKDVPEHGYGGHAELQAAMALALRGLNRPEEAHRIIYQSLKTCIDIIEFIALMQVMPVVVVMLSDVEERKVVEFAVELWAMAKELSFVGESKLYAELVGIPLQEVMATLPSEVVIPAQERGRNRSWWPTARETLQLLDDLGWS